MGGTAPAHRSGRHGTKSWNVVKKGSCKAVATVVGLMLLVLGILDLESGFVRGLSSGILLAVLSERERAPSSSDPIFSSPDLPSCLARTQHLLYRKQALRFPTPPRILDLFHRYSEMHRRCTAAAPSGSDGKTKLCGRTSSKAGVTGDCSRARTLASSWGNKRAVVAPNASISSSRCLQDLGLAIGYWACCLAFSMHCLQIEQSSPIRKNMFGIFSANHLKARRGFSRKASLSRLWQRTYPSSSRMHHLKILPRMP